LTATISGRTIAPPTRRFVLHYQSESFYGTDSALVEIDSLGIGDRGCIGISRRRTGLSHWLPARSWLCRADKLPLWLILLIVLRAGVVEESFYRGYAIERLRIVGFGRFWSITIPLVIFSLAHWSGGAANSLIALAAAAVLSGFYSWRRDLVANMIGHCLVGLL
jgi:membrane protease YdiL (CAAX protease family)